MTNQYKFWKGDTITAMTGDNIFVYGANPEFRNGLGAAKSARAFGAKAFGGGRGIVGNTFGLITKNLTAGFIEQETGIVYDSTGERSVSPEMISDNINELYQCALDNPEKKFFLAYKNDGRNLNGYSNEDMWNLFNDNKLIPPNIRFHESFKALAYSNTLNKTPVMNNTSKTRADFTFFWHSPSPFSQWHPTIFKVKDVTFTSAEQFMMYCKAKLFKDDKIAQEILDLNYEESHLRRGDGGIVDSRYKILGRFLEGDITKEEILSNKENKEEWDGYQKRVKALGRKVKGYNEEIWVKHRVQYVTKGNYEKFKQNPDIKEVLLNTGDTIMSEMNPYDKIWATGLNESDKMATDPSKWTGLNLLGEILTSVRDKFHQ